MDFRPGVNEDAVTLLYAAQRHAGTFHGGDLLAAAKAAWQLATGNGWFLVAADSSGERIVGTATTIGECSIVDTSRRHDGLEVLVVAGMIAGPYGIARAAARSRSMGASAVHCFYLGGWSGKILGCDTSNRMVAPTTHLETSASMPSARG